MSTDGQRTLWRRNIAENFNRLSRAHERHRRQTTDDRRQTTDGPTMTYSEHELEFTFAKNYTDNSTSSSSLDIPCYGSNALEQNKKHAVIKYLHLKGYNREENL